MIIDGSTGTLSLDLPPNLINSTTTRTPTTFLLFLFSSSETQLTVPPVANKSSIMAKELYFLRAFF